MTTCHIWPHPPHAPEKGVSERPGLVELSEGGDLMALTGEGPKAIGCGRSEVPQRGRIRGLSDRSARRFRQKLGAIDGRALRRMSPEAHLYFLTVTVHQDVDPGFAKLAFHRICKRLNRLLGGSEHWRMAWKLEAQKRGAPHYHLFLHVDRAHLRTALGERFLRALLLQERAWFESVECGDAHADARDRFDEHCEAGRVALEEWLLEHWRAVTGQPTITEVKVEDPRDYDALKGYLAKYMAKGADVPEEWVGHRFWGFKGKWPQSTNLYQLPRGAAAKMRRWCRAWMNAKRRAKAKARGKRFHASRCWRDRRGSMRAGVPQDLAERMIAYLDGLFLGVRDGPPGFLRSPAGAY